MLSEPLLSMVAEHMDQRDAAIALLRKIAATSGDPHTQARARMLEARLVGE
jgi:hypothetical protein